MTRQTEVQFQSGDLRLAGTLHWPDGTGPHPALVMLQGSGAEDRDSQGYFLPIREQFLERGVAVLSWDKPGIGGSSGDWRSQTLFDRADEALDALGWLRSQPGIDPAQMGIWGHSQGGWIGPLAASQSPDVAFLIVNSGPGISPPDQDLYGVEHTLRRAGASAEEIEQGLAYMRSLHDAFSRQLPYEQGRVTLLEPGRGTPGASYFGELSEQDWAFFLRWSQRPYDPVESLERVTCPILAIFGERDPLVPAIESAEIFARALAVAGNTNVTIRVFPDGDHRICTGDSSQFEPGYLTLMGDWLSQHTRRA